QSHRVLQIPELLNIIFSYLTDNEHITNALVCKKWSDVALDALWREVQNIQRLVRLLSPIITIPNATGKQQRSYCFARPPEPQDWERFLKYSRRVRRLTYDDKKSNLHTTLF
ncbi:hypothetical protein BDN72DRAFT_966336, partial [Pluteus cervinus]